MTRKFILAVLAVATIASLWLSTRTPRSALGAPTEPIFLSWNYATKRVTITEHLPADWEVCLSLGGKKLECKPMQNWTREIPR